MSEITYSDAPPAVKDFSGDEQGQDAGVSATPAPAASTAPAPSATPSQQADLHPFQQNTSAISYSDHPSMYRDAQDRFAQQGFIHNKIPDPIEPFLVTQVMHGAANALGFPVEAVGNVLKYFSIVPPDTKFVGGTEQMRDVAHNWMRYVGASVVDDVPRNDTGHISTPTKILGYAAQAIGGMALPIGGELMKPAESAATLTKGLEDIIPGAKGLTNNALRAALKVHGVKSLDSALKPLSGAPELHLLDKNFRSIGDAMIAQAKQFRHESALGEAGLSSEKLSESMGKFLPKSGMTDPKALAEKYVPGKLRDKVSKAASVALNAKNALGHDVLNRLSRAGTMTLAAGLSGESMNMGGEIGDWLHSSHAAFGLDAQDARFVGQMLGSLAGPALVYEASGALGASIGKSTAALEQAGRKAGLTRGAQDMHVSAQILKDAQKHVLADPNSMVNLSESQQLRTMIEGFNPSFAQVFGSPGLTARFRALVGKDPVSHGLATTVDMQNKAAIEGYKERVFGKSTSAQAPSNKIGTIGNLTDLARNAVNVRKSMLELDLREVAAERSALDQKYVRSADPLVYEGLRTLTEAKRLAVKGQLDRELADVGAQFDAMGIKADMSSIYDKALELQSQDVNTFQTMPGTFGKIVREYSAGKPDTVKTEKVTPYGAAKPITRQVKVAGQAPKLTASFQEFHSLWREVNREMRSHEAAGNRQQVFYLGQIKDEMQKQLDGFAGDEFLQPGQAFRDYNTHYKSYAHTFRQGMLGQFTKRTPVGGYVLDSSDIVRTMLSGKDVSRNIRDFMELHGQDSEGAALLKNGILDNFSLDVMRNGEFRPSAAAAWIARNETALNYLPGMKEYLQNDVSIGNDLRTRQMLLTREARVLDQGTLAKLAGMTSADEAVKLALSGATVRVPGTDAFGKPSIQQKPVLQHLFDLAKSAKQTQPFARAIADAVSTHPNPAEFMAQHQHDLKPIFDAIAPGHWDSMQNIIRAKEISARAVASKELEVPTPADPIKEKTGSSPQSITTILFNPFKRSKESLAALFGGRYVFQWRATQREAMEKALYFDPDLARAYEGVMTRNLGLPEDTVLLSKGEHAHLLSRLWMHGINGPAQVQSGLATPESLNAWLKRMLANQKAIAAKTAELRKKAAGAGAGKTAPQNPPAY